MVKKQDLWWNCGKSGTLHLIPAKDISTFFAWHLKECEECTCIRNGTHTLQHYYPNTALVDYNYKYIKTRHYWYKHDIFPIIPHADTTEQVADTLINGDRRVRYI